MGRWKTKIRYLEKRQVTRIMLKENYINKIKALPESLRQFIGLIIITLIVIISFSILNGIFGQGDDLVKRMKLEEERIAEEKKLSELISKLCLLYTSPSPRDGTKSRMPSSA